MTTLAQKLHPDRFTEMSPFMAAIAGYVLGESWTDPAIVEITVSETEDLVYVRKAGGVGFEGIQSLTDLRNDWNRLLEAADLTTEERREACGCSRSGFRSSQARASDGSATLRPLRPGAEVQRTDAHRQPIRRPGEALLVRPGATA